MTEIILVINDIRSTHNVGAILRTAEGMGVNKILISGYSPYPELQNDSRLPHIYNKLTSRISKTSLGAEKMLLIEYCEDIIAELKKLADQDYEIVSLEQSDISIKIMEYTPKDKVVLILGNELDGVAKEILEISDKVIEIPMLGKKESYNVASSAAIALYHMRFIK
jgi:23S rRNA (guanosine2251-2'-O)-methyltransferase